MKSPSIFGREPAVLAGLIQAVLAFAVSAGWLAFVGIKGQAELALFMAVVIGVLDLYVAYVTRATLLGVAVGLTKALVAFGAVYRLDLSTEQTGFLIAIVTGLLGYFQRTQTEPDAEHSFNLRT